MGLGMYEYYRSFYTLKLRFFPFFPDRRERGIQKVKKAIKKGSYVSQIASVNLAIIYLNENRFIDAQNLLQAILKFYPQNTVLRVFLGKAYFFNKEFEKAAAVFKKVLEIDSSLKNVASFYQKSLELSR